MQSHDFAAVCFGAFAGALLRVLCRLLYDLFFGLDFRAVQLSVIYTVPGPLFKDVLSNILGCIGMGVVVSFKQHPFLIKFSRWYALFATGIMGSLTTFSSWQAESSIKLWVNPTRIDIIFSLLVGFATSYVSLLFGKQIAQGITACQAYKRSGNGDQAPNEPASIIVGQNQDQNDAQHHRHHQQDLRLRQVLWPFISVLAIAFIFLSIWLQTEPARSIPLACLGAAVGASLRFWLSTKLNPKRPNFPLGTFLCNTLGTAAYMSIVIALRLTTTNLATIEIVSSVLLLGFAGGLTTVSSFILELNTLSISSGWIYGAATIIITQVVLLPFNGVYQLITT